MDEENDRYGEFDAARTAHHQLVAAVEDAGDRAVPLNRVAERESAGIEPVVGDGRHD
jgi:hypothetical protein